MKTVHLFPPFFHSALLIATFHFLERKFPPLLNDVPHFIFMNPMPFTLFFKKIHTLAFVRSKIAIFMMAGGLRECRDDTSGKLSGFDFIDMKTLLFELANDTFTIFEITDV